MKLLRNSLFFQPSSYDWKKKVGSHRCLRSQKKGFSKPNAVWYSLTHHSKSGRNLPVVVQVFGAAETLYYSTSDLVGRDSKGLGSL